jgi:cytochrome c biogenesis protein CcmG/thiol:disulfide interchange protein DsbE
MSWKKIWIPALALPIVALLYYGLQKAPTVNVIESPLEGRAASTFIAPTLDGDTLALADLAGKVVVLNFYASWCVACIDEHAVFTEAERYYAGQDFQMVGVIYQDSPENARRWMDRMGGFWPSLIDPNSRIAIDYGVYGVPETYFIGKDGRIAHKQIGPVNPMLMRSTVNRLLAESGSEAGSVEATNGESSVSLSDVHVTDVPRQGQN